MQTRVQGTTIGVYLQRALTVARARQATLRQALHNNPLDTPTTATRLAGSHSRRR